MNCALKNNSDVSNCDVVENLFGVYLLYCLNPKYKGRTYIGYTVNPNRRIGQHNKGQKAGGARRTSNRGPWEMVLIVHGFPNDISALRFEWAWQNPKKSRRLRHFARKSAGEKAYDYCFRILLNMLRIGPWNRLPLTIRWLALQFQQEFLADRCPPMHMPIAYGPVVSKKITEANSEASNQVQTSMPRVTKHVCLLCHQDIQEYALQCLKQDCQSIFHVICLAKHFCGSSDSEQILPITGSCPVCETFLLWGDLVRSKVVIPKKCNSNISSLDQSD